MAFYFSPYHTAAQSPRRGPAYATPTPPQFYFGGAGLHDVPRHPRAQDYAPVYPSTPRHPIPAYGDVAADADDFEAEERAALAHLRSIQSRREAAQRADRQARAEAAAAIQREAFVRAEVERQQQQRQREREAYERELTQAAIARQREAFVRAEIERSQRQREREVAQAAVARQRQIALVQAVQQREREREQAEAQRRAAHAAHAAHRARIESAIRAKAEVAKRHAAQYTRQAAREQVQQHSNEFEQINNILGALFGYNIAQEPEAAAAPAAASKPEEEKEEKKEEKETVSADKAESAKESSSAFPAELNDLLSQFLGLRVEPTSESTKTEADKAEPSTAGVPAGLNEFLGQFGLVFEPEQPEVEAPAPAGPSTTSAPTTAVVEPKTIEAPVTDNKVEQPAPAAESSTKPQSKNVPSIEDTPLTAFLNGRSDLPFFIRDILGNVEQAFKEEAKSTRPSCNRQSCAFRKESGKGKGVAEGEKTIRPVDPVVAAPTPASPAPAAEPTSTDSLSKLSAIDHELQLVLDSFTFPARLSFGAATPDSTPSLLFNKTNSGYHAQANKLLQLLLAADGIASGGDKEVRSRRKEIVRHVEREIERLEQKRDGLWEATKAKRDAGEVSEDEDSGTSTGTAPSVIDHEEVRDLEESEHIEHVEHVEAKEDAQAVEAEVFKVPAPALAPAHDATTYAEVAAPVDTDSANNQDSVEEPPALEEPKPEEQKDVAPQAEAKEAVKPKEVDATVEIKDEKKAKVEDAEKHDEEYEFVE